MTTTTKALLQKRVNYAEFGTVTKEEFIKQAIKAGWTVKAKEMDGYQNGDFNRTHFNRLAGEEQTKYEEKMKRKKTVYSIHPPGQESFYDISKVEYDYFVELTQPKAEQVFDSFVSGWKGGANV